MNLNLRLKTSKMNRKFIVVPLIFILLIGISPLASADILATIGMQGLSYVSPELSKLVNGIICVQNPISCVEGKIKGAVTGALHQQLAEASPEASKALSLYNQVQGYIDEGAEIIEELQVDEQGQIQEGKIQFGEESQEIGNLIGEEVESDKIIVSGIDFEKSEGTTTLTFTSEESFIATKDKFDKTHFFRNIRRANSYSSCSECKSEDETNKAYVKFNEQGEIFEADFTTNEEGGIYAIGNDRINVPPNSQVLFKDGKITIAIPNTGESIGVKLPSAIDPEESGNIVAIRGENIELLGTESQVILTSGVVHIKGDRIFVPQGSVSAINEVLIIGGGNTEVDLFFDGLEHSESEAYISMDVNNKKLIASMDPLITKSGAPFEPDFFTISPLKDSVFLANQEENDIITFDIHDGSLLSIQDRTEQGLIPEVIVQTIQGEKINGARINNGQINLENGGTRFIFYGDELSKGTFRSAEKKGSIPLEIKFQDAEGNNILGTKEQPQKIIVSNYGEFAAVQLDFTGTKEVVEGYSRFTISDVIGRCPYGVIGCTRDSRLRSFDSALSSLGKKGVYIRGGIGSEFEGKDPREFLTKEQIKNIESMVEFIPEGILETETIVIYPDDYWNDVLKKENFAGFARRGSYFIPEEKGSFFIPERSIDPKSSTFYHEGIHNFHFSQEGSNWEKAWLRLDGSYSKDRGELTIGEHSFVDWADGSFEPRYGKVRAYGENNKFEDIATVAPYILESLQEKSVNPYWEIIDPTSDFYGERLGNEYSTGIMDARMAQEWSDIYLGKLFLAYDAGMITFEQHEQIIQKVPEEIRRELKERELEIYGRISK